jgi:outer membrane protein OmpA-like peptidoglycan-associated protein
MNQKENTSKNATFEVKPQSYLDAKGDKQSVPSSSSQRYRILIAKQQRRLDEAHPDPQTPYITGCYEENDETFILNINQAGSHIEGWLVEVLNAKNRKREKKIYNIGGERQDDGSFSIYNHADMSRKIGTLSQQGEHLVLEINDESGDLKNDKQQYVRHRNGPALSEHAILSFPKGEIRQLVAAYDWAPLVTSRVIRLKQALSQTKLLPLLKAYFDVGSGGQIADVAYRQKYAKEFDWYIGSVFSTDPPDGWHPEDIAIARIYAQQILAAQRWTYNSANRSLIDWINVMLTDVQAELNKLSPGTETKLLQNTRENLNLKPEDLTSGKIQEHLYDFEMEVVGIAGDAGIGLGGFLGNLTITKSTAPTWKMTYSILLGGASGGYSAGIQLGFKSTGKASTLSNWLPGDIPGWFKLVDLSGKGALVEGLSYGGTLMILDGSGSHPGMAVDFSKWSTQYGVSYGAELGVSLGYIFKPGEDLKKVNADYVIQKYDYSADAGVDKSIHFPLGSALLTKDGRQALHVFCATELASLMSTGSRLVIDGHADRLDTKERNIELSELRAKNTFQAIKDILGDKFKIPEGNVIIRGLGEHDAEKAGDKDETPNPKWRKIEIVLNSRLLVALNSE